MAPLTTCPAPSPLCPQVDNASILFVEQGGKIVKGSFNPDTWWMAGAGEPPRGADLPD